MSVISLFLGRGVGMNGKDIDEVTVLDCTEDVYIYESAAESFEGFQWHQSGESPLSGKLQVGLKRLTLLCGDGFCGYVLYLRI